MNILMDDRFFAVSMILGMIALGILIYVTITMSRKKTDKTLSEKNRKDAKINEIIFAITTIIVGLFLILKTTRHFHLKRKFLII